MKFAQILKEIKERGEIVVHYNPLDERLIKELAKYSIHTEETLVNGQKALRLKQLPESLASPTLVAPDWDESEYSSAILAVSYRDWVFIPHSLEQMFTTHLQSYVRLKKLIGVKECFLQDHIHVVDQTPDGLTHTIRLPYVFEKDPFTYLEEEFKDSLNQAVVDFNQRLVEIHGEDIAAYMEPNF